MQVARHQGHAQWPVLETVVEASAVVGGAAVVAVSASDSVLVYGVLTEGDGRC